MNYKKLTITFLCTILLFGCGSSKQVSELDLLPNWAKSRPVVPGAYVGIGSAKKVGTSNQYIAKARENALSDLASEISVRVNSSSVLHSVSSELGMSETLYTRNKLTTSDYFEGFEPVEYYDGISDYWVYYKIDKQEYQQKKDEKKANAIKSALSFYEIGAKADETKLPAEALQAYLKGLEQIKDYYTEALPTTLNNQTLDIGQTLFKAVKQLSENFTVNWKSSQIKVLRSADEQKPLVCTVYYKNQPVQDIDLSFSFSGGYLNQSREKSNSSGECAVILGKIKSPKQMETLTATIDLYAMSRKAVEDLYIRGFMKKMQAASAYVTIDIQSPVLKIIIDGPTQDLLTYKTEIEKQIQDASDNYKFKIDPTFANNYTLQIQIKSHPDFQAGNMFSIKKDVEITMLTTTGNTLAQAKTLLIEGTGSTLLLANQAVWKEIINTIKTRLLKDVLDEVFIK